MQLREIKIAGYLQLLFSLSVGIYSNLLQRDTLTLSKNVGSTLSHRDTHTLRKEMSAQSRRERFTLAAESDSTLCREIFSPRLCGYLHSLQNDDLTLCTEKLSLCKKIISLCGEMASLPTKRDTFAV